MASNLIYSKIFLSQYSSMRLHCSSLTFLIILQRRAKSPLRCVILSRWKWVRLGNLIIGEIGNCEFLDVAELPNIRTSIGKTKSISLRRTNNTMSHDFMVNRESRLPNEPITTPLEAANHLIHDSNRSLQYQRLHASTLIIRCRDWSPSK